MSVVAAEGGPLRVGFDLVPLASEAGGIGRYAAELIPGLLTEEPGIEITAFITGRFPRAVRAAQWAGSVNWVEAPFCSSRLPLHLPYQQLVLPLRRALRRLDLVHGVANTLPLATSRARRVMTLHDLIWVHHPEVVPSRLRRAVMNGMAVAGARRADRILTDSLASRDDLVATAGLDPARIDVAPLGVRARPESGGVRAIAEVRRAFGIGNRRLALCVGQKRPHKNLERLTRAFARLGRSDVCLVMVGESSAYEEKIRRLAAEVAPDGSVRVYGWVSDADLEGLYALADCVVLPSLCEGFGLTALESMARGVPVACSDIPALREVVGGAALLFDPRDEAAITAALGRVLDDRTLRRQLVKRGFEHCKHHPWERTARATLATYRRALDEPASGAYARRR